MSTIDVSDVAHTERIRPVLSGLSEGCESGTYTPTGTNGILMRIVNPSTANDALQSSSNYATGNLIRVSTNRIYAGVNQNSLGTDIMQPGSDDGGTLGDVVGSLIGYVTLSDGESVDLGIRSASFQYETSQIHTFTSSTAHDQLYGVRRNTANITNTDVRIIGIGGTDETLTVNNDSAETTITYTIDSSGTTENYTLQDQIITDVPSSSSEAMSGSPITDANGALVGLWVGENSSGNGVIQKISNIEQSLGARTLTGIDFRSFNSPFVDRMFTGDPLTPRLDEYGTTG